MKIPYFFRWRGTVIFIILSVVRHLKGMGSELFYRDPSAYCISLRMTANLSGRQRRILPNPTEYKQKGRKALYGL